MLFVPEGMEFLGSTKLSAIATTTGVLNFPARDFLVVVTFIFSMSAGNSVGLRFNGDSGTNYRNRGIRVSNSSTTLNNVQGSSLSLYIYSHLGSSRRQTSISTITNMPTNSKVIATRYQSGSASAANSENISIMGGEWVNTTDQITSIEMLPSPSTNMNVGSGFVVLGRNF